MSTTSPSADPADDDQTLSRPEATPAPDAPGDAVEDTANDDARAPESQDAGVSDEPATQEPSHLVVDVADPARRRRAPRYGRFGFIGLLLGAAVSLGLTLFTVSDDGLSARNLFFLLLLTLGSVGLVLGLLTAMWIDRRSLRRR